MRQYTVSLHDIFQSCMLHPWGLPCWHQGHRRQLPHQGVIGIHNDASLVEIELAWPRDNGRQYLIRRQQTCRVEDTWHAAHVQRPLVTLNHHQHVHRSRQHLQHECWSLASLLKHLLVHTLNQCIGPCQASDVHNVIYMETLAHKPTLTCTSVVVHAVQPLNQPLHNTVSMVACNNCWSLLYAQ